MYVPPLSLYVHLPWCERKCPYCDFNSHETRIIPETAYVDALLADLTSQVRFLEGRSVQTLFIGGGTPSLFSAEAISRLMRGIGDTVALTPDLEATMEANPGSAEADKFAGFHAAGINRLSIGIQSFNDAQLQALGRVHNSDQAHNAIQMAREAGFDNFNLDLMHGLPGQSPEAGLQDIHTALTYQPPHLSWYQLTIEANTVFYKRPPELPVEDDLAAIQDAGEQALADAGLVQYEVSAYSAGGRQCRHNRNYWMFGDYLAIGAGAHGKVTGTDGTVQRFHKRRQPDEYLAQPTATKYQPLDATDLRGEFMLNALRLREGFSLSHFEAMTGLERKVLTPMLDTQHEGGLLAIDGERIRASDLGWRYLDSVIQDYLQ